jgi:hypothetical protein
MKRITDYKLNLHRFYYYVKGEPCVTRSLENHFTGASTYLTVSSLKT